MKKFTVAVLIIAAFIFYSLLFSHTNQVAVVPNTSTNSKPSSPSVSSTPADGGAPAPVPTTTTNTPSGTYKDGSYTGSVADAHWGNIQVKAIIQNGKITDVQFLQFPNDRNRSIMINNNADPQLTQEAIQVQDSNVDIVTGATDSSEAFIQSLSDALTQAKA
ncbi:hypothetical protein KDA_02970 [Dictyobacter alpinus]|uniref:FMN-binding domain-containing protein n=1 Tax=Dictyobacter alpinus TaxID=2014873 RepID=A0A402B0D6_9CHLR|nr:FMN-binding protein [Dictyobacter alpinus]GCE24813.1 hypothetical protein KDA_02970 [Dictyobacter alpinus]